MPTTFNFGRFNVTRIEEMLTPGFDPAFLFPDYQSDILTIQPQLSGEGFWHAPSGKLMSSMHSWLIRTDQHVILIDTGCGNGKSRALPLFERFHQLNKPYLDRLAQAGVNPQDVTLVINTHLHVDHVGWNTQWLNGQWVPTFPNAKYIFGRSEFKHWSTEGEGLSRLPENQAVIEDSVLPIVQAGLHELADDGAEIIPGLRMHDLSGHTQGQMMVMLSDGHHSAVFPGDALHQPMQIYEPTWNSRFCELADVAIKSRLRLLEHCADREACLFPAHFGHPHGGWVQRAGECFSFQPLQAHELI